MKMKNLEETRAKSLKGGNTIHYIVQSIKECTVQELFNRSAEFMTPRLKDSNQTIRQKN